MAINRGRQDVRSAPSGASRQRVLAYLADRGGSVTSPSGQGLTREMARALGYRNVTPLNSMLARLEAEGLVEREVRGRRTYRIALTGSVPRTRRRARGGAPAGEASRALRQFEQELSDPRGVSRACILLLLDERRTHGYDLIERLKPFGFERSDPSWIYRSLRWLEEAGFVSVSWHTPAAGPARRVFEVTPAGRQALELSASRLRERSLALDEHLDRYVAGGGAAPRSRGSRSFEMVVEATLLVAAFDEASARRKVKRAFAEGRPLGPGVASTGQVSVYEATAGDAEGE
jgi:PadR family transcriptional regulator PadR